MMRAVLPGNWLNDGVDYTFVESRRQQWSKWLDCRLNRTSSCSWGPTGWDFLTSARYAPLSTKLIASLSTRL